MHIAIIRHSIHNRESDKLLFTYIDYLVKQGHSIFYYANNIDTELICDEKVDFRNMLIPSKIGTAFFTLFSKIKADVVLTDSISMACLAWLTNRKRVVYFAQMFEGNSSASAKKLASLFYTVAFEIFHIPVISVDEKLSKRLAGFNPVKVITSPLGVDLDVFKINSGSPYFKKKSKSVSIVFFASNSPEKALDVGINALSELASLSYNRDWELWVVGEELKPIQDIKITNFGDLDENGIKDILSAADILLISSKYEGLSKLLLQALACECAIAATESVSAVVNKKEGLLSPLSDHKALAINLDRLIEDNELRETLKRNSRNLAQQYSLEESCVKFEKALSSLNPFS